MIESSQLTLTAPSDLRERVERLGGDVGEMLLRAFSRGLDVLEALAQAANAAELRPEISGRASLDLLTYRALVLTERDQRLGEAVGALADESRELHDQLWTWHQRVDALKVKLGWASRVRPRPEPALTIGGGRGKRRLSETERLLEGKELVELRLDLPPELAWRLARLDTERLLAEEWHDCIALAVLAHGVALLEHEHGLAAGGEPTASRRPPQEALRYRIFELSESIRILQIRHTAFSIDNPGMKRRLAQLQEEAAALERELEARGPASEPAPRSLLGKLLDWRHGGS